MIVLLYATMKDFPKLWPVRSKVVLLSHGQATVERGFSINDNMAGMNQSEASLICRRVVKDHFTSVGGLTTMVVTENLLTMGGVHAHHRFR